MKELSNELKKKLGLIIEHERLVKYETNKVDWNYKTFLQVNEQSICDLKTYRKLRQGHVVYKDEIYYVLMKQLGYEIYDDIELNKQLKNLIKEMEFDFNRVDLNRFKRNYVTILELLQPYTNTQPYQTKLNALTLIEKRILHQETISDTQFSSYLFLLPIFSTSFQDLMRFILSDYLIQNHIYDETALHKINLKTHYKSYLFQQQLILLMKRGHHFSCIEPLAKLEKTLVKDKNYNRAIYIKLLLLYSIIQYSQMKSIQLATELESFVTTNHRLCNATTLAAYYVYKGLFHYLMKQYQEGFLSLKKALSYKQPQYYYQIIIYLNYINRYQFIENIDNLYDSFQGIDHPKGSKTKYLYFKMKHEKVDFRTLENYLLSDVLPNLQRIDITDIEVFTDELRDCINETKDYKALLTWNDSIENKK